MLVAAGRVPLWEPALYFGMPMAASMQGGLFYPPTLAYYFFGFATATAMFQAFHLIVAGWLCTLWLRSMRLSWGASLGASILYAFGGVFITNLSFINHLAVLAWLPALGLMFRRPAALILILALMLLAGYPTMIPGAAVSIWIVAWAMRGQRGSIFADTKSWFFAAFAAGAIAGIQLLPGLELAAHSRRSGGMELAEILTWGFSPHDLLQWIGPLAVGLKKFRPSVEWTTCVYIGFCGVLSAGAGFYFVDRRRRLILLGGLVAVGVLILGGSNDFSNFFWRTLPPLHFIRYPGNLAYAALPMVVALSAAGFSRLRFGSALALLAGLELILIGHLSIPLAPRTIFTSAGSLVRLLQENLGETRYLISPKALHASVGANVFDWKQRLYGLTNTPYRIRAASNFGEPLVPKRSYAVLDRLQSLPSADAAGAWMPWIGASRLLTPSLVQSTHLAFEGQALWNISRIKSEVSIARFLSEGEGARLPAEMPLDPPSNLGSAIAIQRMREDRFSISGSGEGWLYVSEPIYPGWSVLIETPNSLSTGQVEPALTAFQKVRTPPGAWVVRWRYRPLSWMIGLWLTMASLLAFSASWYHRASDPR